MTVFSASIGAVLAVLSTYEATNSGWAALAVAGGCILFIAAIGHIEELARIK